MSDPDVIEVIIDGDISVVEVIVDAELSIVEVVMPAEQGPPGQPGIGTAYLHTQPQPASVWTVAHNLGSRRPSVTVTDTAGQHCIGAVAYIDNDTLTISFSAAFAGAAHIV